MKPKVSPIKSTLYQFPGEAERLSLHPLRGGTYVSVYGTDECYSEPRTTNPEPQVFTEAQGAAHIAKIEQHLDVDTRNLTRIERHLDAEPRGVSQPSPKELLSRIRHSVWSAIQDADALSDHFEEGPDADAADDLAEALSDLQTELDDIVFYFNPPTRPPLASRILDRTLDLSVGDVVVEGEIERVCVNCRHTTRSGMQTSDGFQCFECANGERFAVKPLSTVKADLPVGKEISGRGWRATILKRSEGGVLTLEVQGVEHTVPKPDVLKAFERQGLSVSSHAMWLDVAHEMSDNDVPPAA